MQVRRFSRDSPCRSMLRIFCKILLITGAKDYTSSHVRSLRTISSTESTSGTLSPINLQNLTVSYLMNSCGFPIKAATSVAQKICIKNTERPDSVVELFRANGFTNTHIANLITKYPRLLLAYPVKTLKPKIEFFQSLGFSRPDIVKVLTREITFLKISLQKQIIPSINFLKTFIHTNEEFINSLKYSSRILGCNINRVLEPNVATLRSYGVPDSNISKMIIFSSKRLTMRVGRFKDVAALVNNMGFDPNRYSFILAICSILAVNQQNWKRKREAFKNLGWSDNEFLSAFKLQPMVILTSEKKLKQLMDFYVNNLHLKPSAVAKCPNLFLISFEKRIIPRCSVLQVLMSKGLIEKNVNIVSALNSNKQSFEKVYITRYEGQAPEVIKAYKGEMRFIGFDS